MGRGVEVDRRSKGRGLSSGGVVLGLGERLDADGLPNDRAQVDRRDGIETSAEKLIPGDSALERIRWIIGQLGTGLTIAAIAQAGIWGYQLLPLQHAHAVIWIGLVVWVLYLGLERINTLPWTRSWGLFSSFLVMFGAGFSVALLMGWL